MEEIRDGIYICKITKMEHKKSKTNKDMISLVFEISDEESPYYKQKMYMNQVIDTSFGKHLADNFLRSLDTDIPIHFENLEELKNLLADLTQATRLMEFDVKKETKNIFTNFSIVGVYDLIEI